MHQLVLGMSANGTREFLDRWAPAAEWGVAIGTILLAAATAYLARKARDEAKAVRADADAVAKSVVLQEQQMAAAQRPNVYPVAPVEWVNRQGTRWGQYGDRLVVLKNAGPGVAMNVRGKAFLAQGGVPPLTREILAGTIAAGEDVDARIEPNATAVWAGAEGFLTYTDLAGNQWRTAFRCPAGASGMFTFEIDAPALTDHPW